MVAFRWVIPLVRTAMGTSNSKVSINLTKVLQRDFRSKCSALPEKISAAFNKAQHFQKYRGYQGKEDFRVARH